MKIKVKDIAGDLGVQNKKITSILEKYCGVSKKAATSLEESEMDVIFDVITRENAVESLDSYFAARNAKLDAPAEPEAPKQEKPAVKPGQKPAQAEQTPETLQTRKHHQNTLQTKFRNTERFFLCLIYPVI